MPTGRMRACRWSISRAPCAAASTCSRCSRSERSDILSPRPPPLLAPLPIGRAPRIGAGDGVLSASVAADGDGHLVPIDRHALGPRAGDDGDLPGDAVGGSRREPGGHQPILVAGWVLVAGDVAGTPSGPREEAGGMATRVPGIAGGEAPRGTVVPPGGH